MCLVSFACHVSHSFFCQILTCKKEPKYLVSAMRVVRSEKHLAQCLGEERSVWFPLYAFCIHLSGRSGRTPSLIKHSEIASETISGPQIPLVFEECAEISLLEITRHGAGWFCSSSYMLRMTLRSGPPIEVVSKLSWYFLLVVMQSPSLKKMP